MTVKICCKLCYKNEALDVENIPEMDSLLMLECVQVSQKLYLVMKKV